MRMVCDVGNLDILSADDAQKTHKTNELTGSGPIPSVIGPSAMDLLGRVGDDYLRRSVSPGATSSAAVRWNLKPNCIYFIA
jgi:hypothetical protein